jgi:putative transposase
MATSSSKMALSVNLSKERLDSLTKLLVDDFSTIVGSGVRNWLQERGLLLAQLLMNAEVMEVVGERNARNADRDCFRWGSQAGSVIVSEQKIPVQKPRVRTKGASEVELATYEALNDKNFLNEQATAKLLSGVSTRRFKKTIEKMLRGKGIGRQAISDRGIAEMRLRLEEFQTRSLEGVDIVVVFIDGIWLGDTVYVAALGIDASGKKHVLGYESGSTESSEVCRVLLSNLIDRQILDESGGFLLVVDGGTGLKKAIGEVFGNRVEVQRCTEHKKRNVEKNLPQALWPEFRQKFSAAFNKPTHKEAEKAFLLLINELSLRYTKASISLTEGLQQLLTLHKLGVKGTLRRTLCTTNAIESIFSAARYYTRNVKRWRKEEQMDRWIATGLLEAEKNLRRVPGYTLLKELKDTIRNPKKSNSKLKTNK